MHFHNACKNFLLEDIDIKIIVHLYTQNIMRMWLWLIWPECWHTSHAKQYLVRRRYVTCVQNNMNWNIQVSNNRCYSSQFWYRFAPSSVLLMKYNKSRYDDNYLIINFWTYTGQIFSFWQYFAFNTVSCDSFSWFRQNYRSNDIVILWSIVIDDIVVSPRITWFPGSFWFSQLRYVIKRP